MIRNATFNLLVAETGEHLASHFCSHHAFAKNDLYEARPERIKKFKRRFGEVEVKYIDETNISLEQLVELNKKWYEQLPEKQKAK